MKALKLLSALAFALVLAVVAAPTPAAAQADFGTFVQLGDSLTAGFLDGCWVEHGQRDSFGAILARQARAGSFEQPLIREPGLGGCLVLTSLAPTFSRKASTGVPLNLTLNRPYNNLAVPGYTIRDVVDNKPILDPANPSLAALVLRNASAATAASTLQQAAVLRPTFLTVFIGNNDVLGAVGVGTAVEGLTVTPKAVVEAKLAEIFTTMKTAQGGTGKGVVMTVPDVTAIPFPTTINPVLAVVGGNPVRVLGPTGCPTGVPACPVPAGTLVTLNAAPLLGTGFGIPCQLLDASGAPANDPRRANCNKPLPDSLNPQTGVPGVLLYPDELTLIRTRTADINAAINTLGSAAGYKVFDTGAFFADLVAKGRSFGGMTITTAFLSGGFFSYDGVHPTSLGYALAADELIQFINRSYGTSIARPDLTPFLFNGNAQAGGFPVGINLSDDERLRYAAEIYSPENWRTTLYKLFPAVGSPELSLGDQTVGEGPARRVGLGRFD